MLKGLLTYILIIPLFLIQASAYQVDKTKATQSMNMIKYAFQIGYAPTKWKAEQFNWNVEDVVQGIINNINDDFTVYDHHKNINLFFRSTRDYHVSASYLSTLTSYLPFTIKAAEGQNRFFVGHINKSKLSTNEFPIEIGDELIKVNGERTYSEIQNILKESSIDVELTDRSYAAYIFSRRRASSAHSVPKGTIDLTFRKKNKKATYSLQLIWEHTEEKLFKTGVIAPIPFWQSTLQTQPDTFNLKKNMSLPYWKNINSEESAEEKEGISYKNNTNLHELGGKVSFIPPLGPIIWQTPETNPFNAYIYKNKKGQLIGYIRISHYEFGNNEFVEFKKIIEKYKDITDGLVIDQVNNPGGSVFYLYALASVLTDKPLSTPKHRMKIKQDTALEAVTYLKLMEKIEDDKTAQNVLGKNWDGYPVNYQVAEFTKQFYRFLLQQWNSGISLSDPAYLYAADKIIPNSSTQYKKPILILINSLDFSGGDFFPALMQDNSRATLLGTRTAGAGGYVEEFSFPNEIGIGSISITGSIALRTNNSPIENLGVKPDIPYFITAYDLQNNYKNYVKKIQDSINALINK